MRLSFFQNIEDRAKNDKDIFVLTADLGFKLFDNIRSICSDRFYDIGVAEANMIGIASGLSLCGKNVYCYSIAPFLVMRAYEQIRIDVAYHNLNIKLVGVGGGVSYGMEGLTHFGLEDLTLMRSLQNMTIVAPADPFEAQRLAHISAEHQGPMYIRLGKTGEPYVHDTEPAFEIGKAMILSEGKEVAVFAIGSMVHTGMIAAEKLKKKGVNATLINMHTLKPLDVDTVCQIALSHDRIFSLEEHNVHGGLGSAIAEVLAENRYNGYFKRIGISDTRDSHVGTADYLREKYGLSASGIYETILDAMQE